MWEKEKEEEGAEGGGFFAENVIFVSVLRVQPGAGKQEICLLSHIGQTQPGK